MAAYIKFDGVDGPSEIKGHEKWIVLDNWGWGAERGVSAGNQIGLASGITKFEALNFTAPIGSASLIMFQKMVDGEHFPKVTIHCTKSTGEGAPKVWLRLDLEHVLVTKITQNVDEDENNDEVELAFSRLEMGIKNQKADGKLESKEYLFKYDLTKTSSED